MTASSNPAQQECIIPPSQPENSSFLAKAEWIDANERYIRCLLLSLKNHTIHAATEVAKAEKAYITGSISPHIRDYGRAIDDLLMDNMMRARQQRRRLVEENDLPNNG